MEFTRKELWDIRERAVRQSLVEGLNEGWARAFIRLADAACCLDAFIARSAVVLNGEGRTTK